MGLAGAGLGRLGLQPTGASGEQGRRRPPGPHAHLHPRHVHRRHAAPVPDAPRPVCAPHGARALPCGPLGARGAPPPPLHQPLARSVASSGLAEPLQDLKQGGVQGDDAKCLLLSSAEVAVPPSAMQQTLGNPASLLLWFDAHLSLPPSLCPPPPPPPPLSLYLSLHDHLTDSTPPHSIRGIELHLHTPDRRRVR